MKTSLLVVAPGRGSYSRNTLGYIQNRSSKRLKDINLLRKQKNRMTPVEIDAQTRFRGAFHLAGEEASLLTAACSISDFDDINWERYELSGVCGNSMGHYTALILSGVLSSPQGVELIDQMGDYQKNNIIGGQLVYPLCDEEWNLVPERKEIIDRLLQDIPDLHLSIQLGYQYILAGSDVALKKAKEMLPSFQFSNREFPIALPMHSAFHTPLLQQTAQRAQDDLAHIDWGQPHTYLIDGHGTIWSPWSSNPNDIAHYTLGAQVTETYNFTQMIQHAISLLAPQKIALLGPGSNLGGAIIQSIIDIGWFGIKSKQDFLKRQADDPILLSMGREEQRKILCQ